ncbi:hypothetical protein [Gilliamella sp. ESL0254]|uniref:hypothetical protein n=1 Tax=Gilliamella sp. ESL0254 TaxID=2705035 RepID=UPI001580E91D|nr:hypothetical protein [Gilliamella sp. ESL0254]NUF27576.1 hypothetical protein [Gilliamella sp. ESL0254]
MKKNFVAIAIVSMLLTGCSFSFEKPGEKIKPISDTTKLNNVCIYQNVSTISSYNKAGEIIAEKLNTLNITNKLTSKDKLNDCSYTLYYDVRRAIAVPTYLSIMHVQVDDHEGYSVGTLKYSHTTEGGLIHLNSSTFTSTDTKINELLDRLFNVKLDKENN